MNLGWFQSSAKYCPFISVFREFPFPRLFRDSSAQALPWIVLLYCETFLLIHCPSVLAFYKHLCIYLVFLLLLPSSSFLFLLPLPSSFFASSFSFLCLCPVPPLPLLLLPAPSSPPLFWESSGSLPHVVRVSSAFPKKTLVSQKTPAQSSGGLPGVFWDSSATLPRLRQRDRQQTALTRSSGKRVTRTSTSTSTTTLPLPPLPPLPPPPPLLLLKYRVKSDSTGPSK